MSMHKILLTKLELTGLIAHGLEVNKPSQLSDVFRQGVAWAIAENNTELNKLNHKNHMLQNRIDELEARLVIDKLNPNRREHIVQLTSRIDAVMKHIEERYDSQEPWTTPEEVKAILRGGLWS
jgi:hypothetical protein